jgi:hypothetical protein
MSVLYIRFFSKIYEKVDALVKKCVVFFVLQAKNACSWRHFGDMKFTVMR